MPFARVYVYPYETDFRRDVDELENTSLLGERKDVVLILKGNSSVYKRVGGVSSRHVLRYTKEELNNLPETIIFANGTEDLGICYADTKSGISLSYTDFSKGAVHVLIDNEIRVNGLHGEEERGIDAENYLLEHGISVGFPEPGFLEEKTAGNVRRTKALEIGVPIID